MNNECKACKVNILGESARNNNQTSCNTFLQKGECSTLTSNFNPDGRVQIHCNVTNCIHNRNKDCNLQNILVDSETPRPQMTYGTFCSNFEQGK
jgi:hypothetical protein